MLQSITSKLWSLSELLYISKSFPLILQAGIVSVLVGTLSFVVIMYIRQCLLRILLSYRGWMYSPMSKPPTKILLWGLLVRLISGYQPSLYSFQRSLPKLPVPKLHDTMQKLIESLRPILSEEELAIVKKQATEFENTIGPKLQRLLILKSWITPNYVTDWWEKYVYLRSRLPLPVNCNYYILDHSYWKATTFPSARAAALIQNIMKFKKSVDREELPPLLLRNTIPICMAQYERLFSTTRIPGNDIDEIVHYDTSESKHVIVQSNGHYYKLDVYDAKNQCLSSKALENQIQWIIDDIERVEREGNDRDELGEYGKYIATLTGLERNKWAEIRKKHLLSGVNNETRDAIEKAIFCVNLVLNEEPEDLSHRAKLAIHSNLDNCFWFDKCFNIIVYKNGRCSINCEHSMADAPALAHAWEFTLTKDVLETTFDTDGMVFPPNKSFIQAPCVKPTRLKWKINEELDNEIKEAIEFYKSNSEDLDLIVVDHNTYGKGVIKKSKISPDAFVQAAIQLACYKDQGRFVQTYEASMTRLYLNGRTETVRSCTPQMVDFVMCMNDPNCTNAQRIEKLNKMEATHTNLYKDAMNGKGIDRHLFALYVVCKGLGQENEFLQNILTMPWTLSTSQTPHTQQTAVPDPNWKSFNDKLCAGGGFGTVDVNGYGIAYLFPNDHRIFFHISSKKSCPKTDSRRFGKLIFDSLDSIKNLFE